MHHFCANLGVLQLEETGLWSKHPVVACICQVQSARGPRTTALPGKGLDVATVETMGGWTSGTKNLLTIHDILKYLQLFIIFHSFRIICNWSIKCTYNMTSFYPYIILSLWLAGLQSFMIFLHGLTRLSAHRQAQLVLQSKLRAEEAPKSWWYVQSWTVEPGTTSHWLLQRYRMCQEEKHQAASNVEVQVVKPHDMRNPSPAWYLKKSRNILTHFVRKNAAVECLRVAIPRNQPCLPRHRSTAGGSNISKASTQSGIESKLSALDFQTKMGVSSFSDRRFWWTLFFMDVLESLIFGRKMCGLNLDVMSCYLGHRWLTYVGAF